MILKLKHKFNTHKLLLTSVLTVAFCFSTKGFGEGFPGYQGFVFNSYQSFLFNGGSPHMQTLKQKIDLQKPRVLNTLESGPMSFGSNQTDYTAAGSLTFYNGNSTAFRLHFTDEVAMRQLGPSLNQWVRQPGEIKIWCNVGGVIRTGPKNVVFIIKGDPKYDFSKMEAAVPVGECKISDLSTILPNQ